MLSSDLFCFLGWVFGESFEPDLQQVLGCLQAPGKPAGNQMISRREFVFALCMGDF